MDREYINDILDIVENNGLNDIDNDDIYTDSDDKDLVKHGFIRAINSCRIKFNKIKDVD